MKRKVQVKILLLEKVDLKFVYQLLGKIKDIIKEAKELKDACLDIIEWRVDFLRM